MGRLERTIKRHNLDGRAESCKWHRNDISESNKHLRQITYFSGAHYLRYSFSRFFYDITTIEYWNPETNRLETWEKRLEQSNLTSIALGLMFEKRLEDIVKSEMR